MDNKMFFLTFLGGLGCGFASGVVALNGEYEKKFDDQVAALKRNMKDYKDIQAKLEEKKKAYNQIGEETNTGREEGLLTKEQRVKIKEDWSIDKSEIFDYTKFYTQKQKDSLIIAEPEKFIDSVSDESQKEITEYSKEIRRSSMPPRSLSKREMDMIPTDEYERLKLLYYMYDDTLVIDNDELDAPWIVVRDVEDMIGDSLTKNGFDSNSEEYLYVINYTRKEVYTIEKKWASYSS